IDEVRADSMAAYNTSRNLLVVVIVAALAVTAMLAWSLYRVISGSLATIQGTLEDVSQSLDLTRQVPVERMDEIGHTALAFNKLLADIEQVVSAVRGSTDAVSSAS